MNYIILRRNYFDSGSGSGTGRMHMPVPGNAEITDEPEVIRRWIESRGGRPVRRKRKSGQPGMIRVGLPEYHFGFQVEEISWDDFLRTFREKDLVFMYQEKDR